MLTTEQIQDLMADRSEQQAVALATVNALEKQIADLQRTLVRRIREARNAGCSWQDIADLYSVSRQAARTYWNKRGVI
jgi:hypothetical protein